MTFSEWFHKYRLVILALVVAFAFHGSLLLAGSYRGTYDAWVHIFFADHYARSWWNPWEPRWYTGFTLVSYPPLTHQLTALISKFSSLPTGFILVMLSSSVISTLGIYRFSRLWVPHRPATYAALLAVFSSSIAETVHVFGQLPTMFVIGVMLNALPFVWRWVEDANSSDLFRGWALLMAAAAGHHVTTLFGMVFFSGPILATVLLLKFRTPHPTETDDDTDLSSWQSFKQLISRRITRVLPAFFRCGVFGVGLILILVITVLPYWLWSKSDPITQITIPHASRDSFLENTPAGFVFFVIPWGVLFAIIPYAFYKGFGSKNWILASSLALLALLGTGGTTPIPAMMLRGAFYILTLDRFTFWASIVILPFAGLFVESLWHGRVGIWIASTFGAWWRYFVIAIFSASLVIFAIFTANLTQYRKFQPSPVDMTPIVEFLAKDNHDKWRYLTLGFGDQMAWLSAQTTALNVEGNYHSARRLPELTSTPIERLDGAKFTSIPGLGSLQAFLTNPQRYNLKYTFVNDDFYEPLLYFSGWHKLGTLENDVQVWERSDVPPLPAAIPAQVYPAWQRFMWGFLPVSSLFVVSFAFFFTMVIVPRFNLSFRTTPIVRIIARWRLVRFWLIANDKRKPLPPSEDWQLQKKLLQRILPDIRLNPRPLRRVWGVMLLFIFASVIFFTFASVEDVVTSPESIILAYYDDIDFKRFSESYQYLDTELDQTAYLRWLSLQGGILASFAKLENLYIDVLDEENDFARASVTAEWLTALGTYPVEQTWDLNRIDGQWKMRLDVPPPPDPRTTFINTSELGFYLDLPLGTLDETALQRGVLDRALLSVSDLELVYAPDIPIGFTPEPYDAGRVEGRFDGVISLVGAVKNHSPFPTHITVTVILRNHQGERIAETNVMDTMIHQIWSQEVTPFRVQFDGADAADILSINRIASAEVIIRGVPTAFASPRSLILKPDTETSGQLYNSQTFQVDIPAILRTTYGDDGRLLWVDTNYLEQAITPDATLDYDLPDIPEGIIRLPLPITLTGPRLTDWDAEIPSLIPYGYARE